MYMRYEPSHVCANGPWHVNITHKSARHNTRKNKLARLLTLTKSGAAHEVINLLAIGVMKSSGSVRHDALALCSSDLGA